MAFTNSTQGSGKAIPQEPISMNTNDGASDTEGTSETADDLHRDLKPHQVFMFSIACAIGTGLIIGSGSSLAKGGPGSILIAYVMIGMAVFSVMTALGEMAAFLPMKKGFGGYATRMVDPSYG